jgi:hypothetical protein
VTGGQGLWISPEFGTRSSIQSSRTDLYIMGGKNWGIELLREGDELKNHMAGFEPGGAYHPWTQNGSIREYIVLDCRTISRPSKAHAGAFQLSFAFNVLTKSTVAEYSNLCHVVFDDSSYKILDNNLELIQRGVLLA